MPNSNPQLRNAGNLGDILKHAALLTLARLMKARNAGATVNYFETHAFQLRADLRDGWEAECRKEMVAHRLYAVGRKSQPFAVYHQAQTRSVIYGLYRCSCGLVIDTLPDRRLFLAEADAETRATLQSQLATENVSCELLLNDAKDFESLAPVKNPGPLLGLVDPFTSPIEVWGAVCNAATALREPDADGIVEVFSYSQCEDVTWPAPPPGFVGPIATMVRSPFYLAAYATDAVANEAIENLAGLGWK